MDGGCFWFLLFVPAVLVSSQGDQDEVQIPSRRFLRLIKQDPRRRFMMRPEEGRRQLQDITKFEEEDQEQALKIAVAPPFRQKYRKTIGVTSNRSSAVELIKDVLLQLGKEFMMRQVNEDFVFGQYVGNSMRNLTSDLKLRMQHDILELAIKYQKINSKDLAEPLKSGNAKSENGTEDTWKEFNDLAKFVNGR